VEAKISDLDGGISKLVRLRGEVKTVGMTLENQPRQKRQHDKIYTVLLGVLGFLLILGIISLNHTRTRLSDNPDTASVMTMAMETEACVLLAIIVVFLIRILAPAYRKWPTLGLNIVLLIGIPLGTALGIYGLWKVDKATPETSN
jgi:hypothetical protein